MELNEREKELIREMNSKGAHQVWPNKGTNSQGQGIVELIFANNGRMVYTETTRTFEDRPADRFAITAAMDKSIQTFLACEGLAIVVPYWY